MAKKTSRRFKQKKIPKLGKKFIAWKKVYCWYRGVRRLYILKLLIPANTPRVQPFGGARKCRSAGAKVLAAYNEKGKKMKALKIFTSYHHRQATLVNPSQTKTGWAFTYQVGKMVLPDKYDDDKWSECTHGIHFYLHRTQAENHG